MPTTGKRIARFSERESGLEDRPTDGRVAGSLLRTVVNCTDIKELSVEKYLYTAASVILRWHISLKREQWM